ncbi:MAG: ABC transporter ATP-binding protein [Actinomycetota bacterium]|nr:ABC transporter ATP-binding protein [Actinomycetota bacterium]
MSEPLFSCSRVSRTFGSGNRAVVAVHDVTCTADRDARVAITGPSGSGKSTLLHLIAGLDRPSKGEITWPGLERPPDLDPASVGVVFQNQSLIPTLTAVENVGLPLVLRDIAPGEAHRLSLAAMNRLGIEGVANQLPDELSGGQAQRVAVARVLTMQPVLILADEPTGRLDQKSARQVIEVLVRAADEIGAGLVITTHDVHVTELLPDRWRMRDGNLQTSLDTLETAR